MTTYETVVGEHKKLRTYLKIAEERKDAEMIRRWRAFVWEVLYPLDKEVLLNSHFGLVVAYPNFQNFSKYRR